MLDEVAFGLELGGMDRAEALRRAQLVIDRFGLPADEGAFLAFSAASDKWWRLPPSWWLSPRSSCSTSPRAALITASA